MSQPLSQTRVVIPDTDPPPSTPVVVVHMQRNNIGPDLGLSDWNPDIDHTSSLPLAPSMQQDPTIVQVPPSVTLPSDPQNHIPHNSPCFVHSHLDKGTLLADWLRNKHHVVDSGEVGVAKSLQRLTSPNRPDFSSYDEDEFVGSLTKQLADTAVGVREMSKQLGAFLPHSSMIL
jgi:NAD+ kinase